MPYRATRIIVALAGATLAAGLAALSAEGAGQADPRAYDQPVPGTGAVITMVAVDAGRIAAAAPGQEPVEVPAFWMSSTEVAWDVYDVYAFGLDLTAEERSGAVDAVSRPTKPYGAADRGFGHDGYPALGMTYRAAAGFADWLSARSGIPYRLPTAAEWALACSRLGGAAVVDVAWTWDTSFDGPQPVGSRPASPGGLHDLLGNVAEWVTGADGAPLVRGGSFRDKTARVGCDSAARPTPAWNERDPQIPKSQWWLSDAPFVGIRLVSERGPADD